MWPIDPHETRPTFKTQPDTYITSEMHGKYRDRLTERFNQKRDGYIHMRIRANVVQYMFDV